MNSFQIEYTRRVEQFQHYLRLMDRRRREVGRDCFLILEEESGQESGEQRSLARRKARRHELVAAGEVGSMGDQSYSSEGPEEADSEAGERGPRRFVQFAFWERFFVLDIPNRTLFPPEAEKILRDRRGFFYVGQRADYPYYRRDVANHNPFQKQFIYGDERTAAEDVAFIFFQVWLFPVDSRLYVKAATFSGGQRWESGKPIE